MCLFSVAGHKRMNAFFLGHIKVFIICRRNASFMCFLLNTYLFLCNGDCFPIIFLCKANNALHFIDSALWHTPREKRKKKKRKIKEEKERKKVHPEKLKMAQ